SLLFFKVTKPTEISALPGDAVTIWCQHTANVGEIIHWFKQTKDAVPHSIVYQVATFQSKKQHVSYQNDYKADRFTTSLHEKNTSLTILNVEVSDSGLYFCAWGSIQIIFGGGTHLDIGVKIVKNPGTETEAPTRDDKVPVSDVSSDCSGNIFYMSTIILGALVAILIITSLTFLFIKIRKTQKKDADQNHPPSLRGDNEMSLKHMFFNFLQEDLSSPYTYVQFSELKTRRASRNTEENDVVYSATR
ncbi:hypothetical protein DNTS_001269, partial [Danionella cerebrum]